MLLSEIYQTLGKKMPDISQDVGVREWAIDSRRISNPEESIFVALKGELRDGHDFMMDAYNRGVRLFMGSRETTELPGDATYIQVEDSLSSMQTLAAFQRKKYKGQVIGITGSNGKTICKEWLFYSLAPVYNVYQSPKSYNSQIGVALSLLEMDMDTDFALIEAGISEKGEMQKLHEMIAPDIALLTSIGDAHESGFGSIDEKLQEKLLLFQGVNYAFVGVVESKELRSQIEERLQAYDIKHISIADPYYSYEINAGYKEIKYRGEEYKIHFLDEASAYMSMLLYDVLSSSLFRLNAIGQVMENLPTVSMRMEFIEAKNNCKIISDVYSADLHSIKIALARLDLQAGDWKKSLILSDLNPNHHRQDEAMQEILEVLNRYSFHRIILLGDAWRPYLDQLHCQHLELFTSKEELKNQLDVIGFEDEFILIKAARYYELEDIVDILKLKKHSVRLEVDLSIMRENLLYYKSLLEDKTKIMAMVKSESYGSGTFEVAKQLQSWGIDYLAVTYIDEGILLRRRGISLPIMVMNPAQEGIEEALDWGLELEIYSQKILDDIIAFAINKKVENLPVHIKFDTGMHRLGFEEKDLDILIEKLKKYSFLKVKSSFTHLHAADVKDAADVVKTQVKRYRHCLDYLEKHDVPVGIRHVLNSAGVENYSQYQFDMVRLGIGLYGLSPSKLKQIQPVSSYIAEIVQIKEISDGEYLGYGIQNKIESPRRIAVINLGYADGYNRALGNGKGYVNIAGKLAYTIGNVCMDMFFVDITELENVHEGDEVCIYGKDPRVDDLAARIGTIGYELLTTVSNRIPRVFKID